MARSMALLRLFAAATSLRTPIAGQPRMGLEKETMRFSLAMQVLRSRRSPKGLQAWPCVRCCSSFKPHFRSAGDTWALRCAPTEAIGLR